MSVSCDSSNDRTTFRFVRQMAIDSPKQSSLYAMLQESTGHLLRSIAHQNKCTTQVDWFCYRYWCISCGTCLSRLVATKNLQNFPSTREQLPRSRSEFSLISVLRLTFRSTRLGASKNVAPCLSTALGSSRTFENKHSGNCLALSVPFLHRSPNRENSGAQP